MKNSSRNPLIILFTLVSVTSLADSHRPATNEELNGMVKIGGCSASLITIGRSVRSAASALSAGHCPSYPLFYKPGEAEAGKKNLSDSPAKVFPPSRRNTSPLDIPLDQLYYATMTNSDVAIYDLSESERKIKFRGLKTFTLADSLPKPGDKLTITSGYWRETQTCEVESILADNSEEEAVIGMPMESDPRAIPHSFHHSILFKDSCYGRNGWSGSSVIDPKTNQIYGVVSRLYETQRDASLTRFAEFIRRKWNPFNPEVETPVRVVASNVTDLVDCLEKDGSLNFRRPGCVLPIPNH